MPPSRHTSVNWTLGLAMIALGAAPFVRAAGRTRPHNHQSSS